MDTFTMEDGDETCAGMLTNNGSGPETVFTFIPIIQEDATVPSDA